MIIFSTTFEEHLQRLTSLFQKFKCAGLNLKLKKCKFAQQSVTYLGHIISHECIKPDMVKPEAVTNYLTPARVTKKLSNLLAFLTTIGVSSHGMQALLNSYTSS